MKKFISLVMAIVLFASSSYAGILDSVKYYGEGSFYGAASQGMNDYLSGTGFYGILGLQADVYENITASFALGYTRLWGNNLNNPVSGVPVEDNNYGLLNNLKIVEANIAFDKIFDVEGLKIKVGRQFYGDEDSTVMYFGVRRDDPLRILNKSAITSIDAITAYYENEHIKANAVFATFQNYSANSGKNNNTTLSGIDFKYLNIADMIDIEGYFYDMENLYSVRHYDILGAKGTFHKDFINENVLTASAEIAKNFAGEDILSADVESLDTNLIKLDASFEIKNIGLTPRASVGFFGGWDKKTGVKHFRSFGNYAPGLISINEATSEDFVDLQVANLGADYTLKKFTFSVDFFNFDYRQYDGSSNAFPQGELDLQVTYAYTENIDFNIGIGHLFAKKSDNDIAYTQAGLSYKF
ncbi:MAG: hypothetical protein LBD46_07660 [Endomicrobium sp.]|jgi:hypothetical protein|nr:hypothetical protein [Endomicrobium sp.]